MRTFLLAYLALSLVLVTLAQDALLQDESLEVTTDEIDQPADVCAALYDAQSLLPQLEAAPNAHLDRKVGTIGTLGSKGWGDGLGWGHEGPLSTAFRLLPRLINSLLSPLSWLSRSSPSQTYHDPYAAQASRSKVKITKARRAKINQVHELLNEAEQAGCGDVHGVRGKMMMASSRDYFPPRGMRQDLPGAFRSFEKYLEIKTDAEAQFMVGLFHSTGLGGVEEDQGKASLAVRTLRESHSSQALLYHTFAALQGYRPAEMAMGYRHWAGIGVKEDCMTALDYYEGAAEKAYDHFLSGPPGGRTLPLTTARLSDLVGGIYGPHASWASTGANALRPAVRAISASARGETEAEVLEYYQYHSDRDSHVFTVRLGRVFYLGSVYPIMGGSSRGPGISAGAEGVGEIPQSFTKAREYFMRAARTLWPKEFDTKGNVAPKRKLSQEAEDALRDPAMVAAAFLGRMAMRGEGQKVDYKRARMWYERAAELGDREAFNGLGIIHRDGLGTPIDKKKAYHYFQGAAGGDLAEAQVNLGKIHLERGELQQAFQYFEVAIRHGSPFEAFHLLAQIHATTARLPAHAGGERGHCGVSVAYYKLVSERGSWQDSFIGDGDRAWARGDEETAFVKWLIAAEMGSEVGQNNVAFLLDQGKGGDLFMSGRQLSSDAGKAPEVVGREQETALGMRYWIRSAAQDNVDAMVKVGDLYYAGLVDDSHAAPLEVAANYYQTAADTQTSAMAYWNLGWMYEMGKGVPRDWHLAKRYYDMSGETALEAWPAALLSTIGLYLRSWWVEMRSRGEIPGLRMFEPLAEEDLAHTSIWDRIGNMFAFDPAELDQSEYDDLSGSQWAGGQQDPDAEHMEWEDEFAETVIILLVVGLIMLLVWTRQIVTRMMDNQRNAAAQREREVQAAAEVAAVLDADRARQVQQAEEMRREQERRLEDLERLRREMEMGENGGQGQVQGHGHGHEQEYDWHGGQGEIQPL